MSAFYHTYLDKPLEQLPIHAVASCRDVPVPIPRSLKVVKPCLHSFPEHQVLVSLLTGIDQPVQVIIKDSVMISEVLPGVTTKCRLQSKDFLRTEKVHPVSE